jgi:hypothetical protein
MAYLLAGPFVAIIGIVAVYFVLHRKSVDKRSMYSARREQIEHKVRAARQRTMAGHGHVEKAPEPAPGASPFAQTQVQPTVTYEAPVYSPPPAAPLAPPPQRQPAAPAPMPWEQPSIPPPAPAQAPEPMPSAWDVPSAPAAPAEPFTPSPAPATIPPAPSEPAWTPAPQPAEPPRPMQPVAPAASTTSATSAGGWSVVSTPKESAEVAESAPKKKGKKEKAAADTSSSWQLASGDAPGMEADEPEVKQVSRTLVAVAQYAVLVVGLVMVLIGVMVMVANSRVT